MYYYDKYMVENQTYYDAYRIKNGNKKVAKITKTIYNSRHSASLLYQSLQKRVVPTAFDFGACVNSNLSIGIAGFETTKFAAIMLLDKWHNEVNLPLGLADETELLELLNKVKKLC